MNKSVIGKKQMKNKKSKEQLNKYNQSLYQRQNSLIKVTYR